MRESLWISSIGLALAALLLSPVGPSLPRSPLDHALHAIRNAVAADRQQTSNDRPGAKGASRSRVSPQDVTTASTVVAAPSGQANSPPRLDEASPNTIHRVLEEAIEREQRLRPLWVDPSILDQVAEHGRIRVVFDWMSGGAIEPRLSGPGGSARLDGIRLFPTLDYAAARVGPEALLALIQSGTTRHIEVDAVHRPSLFESLPVIGADLAHQLESDGDGRVVAVLDTGIQTDHPMFAGRLVEEACFSTLSQCPNGSTQMFGPGAAIPCAHSQCSHGTHVTGIAVGQDPVSGLTGVAPQSRLIAIQIFSLIDDEIGSYSSDILAGLQHVLRLAPFYDIDAVNLSLGGNPHPSEAECDQAAASQRSAIAQLRNQGIVVVAASGNEGFTNAISQPACLSNVLSVGSTTDFDLVSSFSNSASFLSVLAPGQSIESAGLGSTTRFGSGTSMASPHVAGAIASLREAQPAATVAEIENALVLSGTPVLDTRNGEVHPRIEVQNAIDLIAVATPPPPPYEPEAEAPEVPESNASAASPASGGGGGGGCGLVGIETFLVLGLIRVGRRARRTGLGSKRICET